ncbi:MAG: dicarboxylate/amino acid:cation symporter [Planctomycetes bacterium]|nr:dicarboxylate/amino acid:cation symporter [Planctomycetota bacterium]
MTSGQRVFVGLVSGAAAGFALASRAPGHVAAVEAVAKPIGTLWLHALQMTVVPFVVALIVVGVAQAAEVAAGGRIARRALAWIVVLAGSAAAFAAVAAPRIFAACPRASDLVAALRPTAAAPAVTEVAGLERITGLVPVNVVAAAAEGAIAPLVVFALFFAFAVTRLPAARREPVVALAHGIADAMVVIVDWVLLAGPIGVFALILPVAMRAGTAALGALGIYVAVLVAIYLAITAAVYLVACLGGGESLARFAAAILPAQAVAAGTQSSLASMPAMLKATTALGYPPRVGGLVLPLAVSLFRITSPAQYVTVASFIGWAHGTPPDAGALALAALLAVVISLGSVGLPGQASFMGTNLPVVQAAGMPVEPLGLLLAVDVIPDVFATVGNVTADLALACRVARAEHATARRSRSA